jgi:hypothetical protein
MFAVLEQLPVLQDALIGAGVGALFGKSIAARHRPGANSIRIEVRWTWIGTGLGLLAQVVLG